MTEQALLKAKIDLYNILSNHAWEDNVKMNHNSNGNLKNKKNRSYSFGSETEKAMEMYHMVYGKKHEDIILEQEEQVKGYLLIYRISRTEYLQEEYKGGKWYYQGEIDKLGIEI